MTHGRPLFAALLLALTAGCASASSSSSARVESGDRRLTVFAASSLTDAFTAIGAAYRQSTGTTVRFSFAGSQDLATQVEQGAPADVLATADEDSLARVADDFAGASQVFARNTLVIVTAPRNPHHVSTLADLSDVSVVLADPSVPAGKYAAAALSAAGVSVTPKSLELDVRGVLTKVELGEADAGIVYATDAEAAGGRVTAVPVARSPVATYPLAALTAAGGLFVDFVRSAEGARILHRYGFLPP